MDIKKSLSFVLNNFANTFRANLEVLMSEVGLHSGQVFVLISLWQEDGQNQISLAQNLSLAPPTVNKMVKTLVDNNFVSCNKCETDGRMMRVYLTDKGRAYEDIVKKQWLKIETVSFSGLTETEKLILSQLLIKMKENSVKKAASE